MRRRLLLTIAATSTVILCAFLVPLAILVQDVSQSRATSSALLRVQSLVPVVGETPRRPTDLAVQQINSDGGAPVTVFFDDGSELGASAEVTDAVRLASTGQTVVTDTPEGREVAVPVVGSTGATTVIRAIVEPHELAEGVLRARLALLALGAVLLLLAVAIGDRLARSFVRPLETTADTAHRLAAGQLDARADVSGPPETRTVAAALNRLAGRIRELLRIEREAAADLSHRLRTPVTALRLDVEALPDGDERDRLVGDLESLTSSIDAIIHEARRHSVDDGNATCDATAVVADRVHFWKPLADDEHRATTFELPDEPVLVACAPSALGAAIDALLGNVFAHTPAGTPFSVRLTHQVDAIELTVEDFGHGWPDADITSRGESPAGSTGLGLDIVRRTAIDSGGSVELSTGAGGGARVRLVLGRPVT